MSHFQNKHIFLFLVSLSISHLQADTNTSIIEENHVQELSAQEAKELAQNPFVQECKDYAEYLDMIIRQILSININQGMRLAKPLQPVLGYCNEIKKLPETASAHDLYKTISLLNECAHYIIKAIEDNSGKLEEFLPLELPKENLSAQDFEEVLKKFDTTFKTLLQKAREVSQDFIGTLLMHVCDQLNQLDRILQTINNNVDNSAIVNKKDIKKEIMLLRNNLRQIQKEVAGAGSDPEAIKFAFQYNKAVSEYLADSQAHHYRKWSLVDLESAFKRNRLDEDASLAELYIDIMMTSSALAQLEKNAEKIDLTMVNRAARFVGDYVVDPLQRYSLDTYSMMAVAAGFYGAYYFDDYFFPDKDSIFRRYIKFRNHSLGKTMVSYANPQDNPNFNKPIGLLGKAEEFIYDQYHSITPLGAGLCLLIANQLKAEWKDKKPKFLKKMNVWFDKLKGGAIAKNAEKYDMVISSITFDDIIGLEYEKSLVYPHLKYIKDPERWDANGLTPPTGILLTGPTRAGKTFFAKAICGEIHRQNPDKQIRFVSIDVHDIKADGIATWMGVAKMLAPCVLFIDEIDLLGLQRSQDKSLLSDFLQALSGITEKDPKRQVIVVGTTNKPENIDTALIQSGRFALEIRFKYPNLKERKEFIRKRLEKFAIDPEVFEIDIDKLARETHEKSFEDIKLMMDTAFIQVGIKGQIISQDILESALDVQLRRVIDIDTKQISETEKRLIAAHYAGQTLTHILLNMEEKIAKATIRQAVVKVKEESVWNQYDNKDHQKQIGLDHGALFTYFDNDSYDLKNEVENIKKAKTFLGARIAERILTNNCSIHFGWKKNAAYNLVKAIVADGVDIKSTSESRQNAICDETDARLKEFEKEVEALLREHTDTLAAIAQELYSKQTLTIDQINKVIEKVEKQEMPAASVESIAA